MKDGRMLADKTVVPFSSGQHHNKYSTLLFFRALVKRSFFFSIEIWLVQVSNVFDFLFRSLLWPLTSYFEYSINKQQSYLEFSNSLFLQANLAGSSLKKVQPEHRRLWPKQWLLIVFIITVNISPKVSDFQIFWNFYRCFRLLQIQGRRRLSKLG